MVETTRSPVTGRDQRDQITVWTTTLWAPGMVIESFCFIRFPWLALRPLGPLPPTSYSSTCFYEFVNWRGRYMGLYVIIGVRRPYLTTQAYKIGFTNS